MLSGWRLWIRLPWMLWMCVWLAIVCPSDDERER